MARTDYISGRQMGGGVQFLNSRDLIWSRQTHRYLPCADDVDNDMNSSNMKESRPSGFMHRTARVRRLVETAQ